MPATVLDGHHAWSTSSSMIAGTMIVRARKVSSRTPERAHEVGRLPHALTDDADLYSTTVAAALGFWRQGLLQGISPAELRALFDGEFWVLSARTRSSGAGFILKRKLASARRELETAMRVN